MQEYCRARGRHASQPAFWSTCRPATSWAAFFPKIFFVNNSIETFMQSALIVCNIFRACRQWRLYIFSDFFPSYTLALTLGMMAVFLLGLLDCHNQSLVNGERGVEDVELGIYSVSSSSFFFLLFLLFDLRGLFRYEGRGA